MQLPDSVLDASAERVLVGTEPGALLAGLPIALALAERGIRVHLAITIDDPLAGALAKTLAARSIPSEIARAGDASELGSAIVLGSGALLHDEPALRALGARDALIALVGLGSEPCAGHDADAIGRGMMTALAEGWLVERTLLHPFDPIVRTWLEIVEDVHHAVGPAEQRPIVDVMRAALFGRHGLVAVDLAARERRAHVTLESASIAWLRPAKMP